VPFLVHTRHRLRLKCDGTRAETRFRLSGKRTSPLKSTGASVQSTTGSRVLPISGSNGSNAGYTMFRGSVKGIDYPLLSPVSPSLLLTCVTACHHVATGLYRICLRSISYFRPQSRKWSLSLAFYGQFVRLLHASSASLTAHYNVYEFCGCMGIDAVWFVN